MLNYEEIKEYCTNYKVENGLVCNKNSNQQVIDEDTIIKVKSSILIFREAHSSYEEDVKQFGKTNKSLEDYVLKTMEKFGVNGESNTYGINYIVSRDDYIELSDISNGWATIEKLKNSTPFCNYCGESITEFEWEGYHKNDKEIDGYFLRKKK